MTVFRGSNRVRARSQFFEESMLVGGPKLISTVCGNSRLLWRAFWVFMLALHLGPILTLAGVFGPSGEPDRGVRLAMLAASALFFALKIADIHWLRVVPGWRSSVCSIMVLGLLHLGPVERAAETKLLAGGEVRLALFAGGLLSVEAVRRGLRRIRVAFLARPAELRSRVRMPRFPLNLVDALRPPQRWIDLSHLVPRAPPGL